MFGWLEDAYDWTKEKAGDAWDGLTGEGGMFGDPKGTKERLAQGQAASDFANRNETQFRRGGRDAFAQRKYMEDIARGRESVSALQLKQALGQNIAGQQSMAASARPGQGAMAARNAMMNAGRAGSALGGQQALAGIQERQAAQNSLNNMILQQRGQDLQGALGSRTNAVNAFNPQGPSGSDKQAAAAGQIGKLLGLLSDKTKKKNIRDASKDSEEFIKSLKAYKYDYKDSQYGKGEQLGIMAQDLLKSKHGKQAIVPTKAGLMVHGPKLAAAVASSLPGMLSRIEQLEGKGKGKGKK